MNTVSHPRGSIEGEAEPVTGVTSVDGRLFGLGEAPPLQGGNRHRFRDGVLSSLA